MTTTLFVQPKENQHYRLTLQNAIKDYKRGFITATGLVFYAIGIYRAPGQKLRIRTAAEFCKLLTISRATFYRALSALRLACRLNWEPVGGFDVWIPTEEERKRILQEAANEPIDVDDCNNSLDVSQIRDSVSQPCDSYNGVSQIRDSVSQPCNSESQPCDNRAARVPSGKGFGKPSDSYQIFLNSLSNKEREEFLIFANKKVSELPKKPTLPDRWIKKYFKQLWQQVKSTRKDLQQEITPPTPEQLNELDAMKRSGLIRDYYSQPWGAGGRAYVVDTFESILPWWEVLNVQSNLT